DARPGAKQLGGNLVANLDAAAGHERRPPCQIGRLVALREVELGAGRTHLIVEEVNDAERVLADVTLAWRSQQRRRRVRRGGRRQGVPKDRDAAELTDAGLVQDACVGGAHRGAVLAPQGLLQPAALVAAGPGYPSGGLEQLSAQARRE